MSPKEHKKVSAMIVEVLKKSSKNGLEFAKKAILAENIEFRKLREALKYYVSNWTDFTHPGLFSTACEAVGGDPDETVRVQAAISMIAAAFDIHDDIIDKSRYKHDKPTVFGKFGKDVALLLGNAFLVKGFTLLGISIRELPQSKMKEIFETLKKSLFELGNAHALELDLKGRVDIAPEQYMKILKMKAASVEADMRIGAIIGEGTSSEVEALTRYGRILGVLSTLREEFIDVFEIDELSHRVQNECLPIPVLYAMQDKESKESIRRLLAKEQMTSEDIDELLDIVFEAKSIIKLKKTMEDLVQEAVHLIPKIKSKKPSKLLRNLAASTLEDL